MCELHLGWEGEGLFVEGGDVAVGFGFCSVCFFLFCLDCVGCFLISV